MDTATLFANTLSTDRALREDATQKLELFAQEDYTKYVLSLCQLFSNEQADDSIRMSAGLALKNSLTAKDYDHKEVLYNKWMSTAANIRNQIKQSVLIGLSSIKKPVANIFGQVVAAIADIELPNGAWPDLIPTLLENIKTNDTALKQSTLQTLGYICESTDPQVLAFQSNDILTAIVQGARKEETSQEVRLSAINALINALDFIKENFDREGERNFIMQVVCEATQSESTDVQVAAFQCLARIMQTYYDKMRLYMEKALFGLTVAGMNNKDNRVVLQAIEFWSTVCDEELDLMEEYVVAHTAGEQPKFQCHRFAQLALTDVIPVLLWILTKQEEDHDEDGWTISMSAATCLSLFAQCVSNAIIPFVVSFIESNIQNEDWRRREAALMAFASILDGPESDVLKPLVNQALPALIEMINDNDVHVRVTVAWTFGRICELLIDCIKTNEHFDDLIFAMVYDLQNSPRIVSNYCWAIINLAEQLGPKIGDNVEHFPLSFCFQLMVTALVVFPPERENNEANWRTSSYEAVSTLVMHSANDCIDTVEETAWLVLSRLETAMAMENQMLNADDRNDSSELESSLLTVLTSCIRRLSRDISQVSDRIMTVVLQILNNSRSKHSSVTEDAFLTVSALMTVLEEDFKRYTESFVPILCSALQNPAEYQLCSTAVGLIGDLYRALGKDATSYCNALMQLLVANLQSTVLHQSVKPAILSCFGDIALAIGDEFVAYLEVVMRVLQQAGSMRAGQDNDDMIYYVNTLHEGCIEAYVGIVQGLNGTPQANMLITYLPDMFNLMHVIAIDSNRTESLTRFLIGLIGDLAEAFAGQIGPFFQAAWIPVLLREARSSRYYSTNTKKTAQWAKEMIKRAT